MQSAECAIRHPKLPTMAQSPEKRYLRGSSFVTQDSTAKRQEKRCLHCATRAPLCCEVPRGLRHTDPCVDHTYKGAGPTRTSAPGCALVCLRAPAAQPWVWRTASCRQTAGWTPRDDTCLERFRCPRRPRRSPRHGELTVRANGRRGRDEAARRGNWSMSIGCDGI